MSRKLACEQFLELCKTSEERMVIVIIEGEAASNGHGDEGPGGIAEFGGSSPRMRGTGRVGVGHRRFNRFTPACAGNGFQPLHQLTGIAVHPRVCGERFLPVQPDYCPVGSSPRVRGTDEKMGRRLDLPRFIPACAGNGLLSAKRCLPMGFIPACAGNGGLLGSRSTNSTVHPRVCGERVSD